MTPSELKYNHKRLNSKSYFFDYDSMRFFGDRMYNYGVRSLNANTWELYRKRPVKNGLQDSTLFDKKTFVVVHQNIF